MTNSLIHKKISKVMSSVGAIGKGRKNTMQNYTFRGIDDMYNVLNKHLSDNGIFFASEIVSEKREERVTKSGGNLIYTILRIKWTVYAEDGSNITTETVGEAMDSADKSSNKAMSASYKYAMMQLFCIPIDEPKDTENDTHEPSTKKLDKAKTKATKCKTLEELEACWHEHRGLGKEFAKHVVERKTELQSNKTTIKKEKGVHHTR